MHKNEKPNFQQLVDLGPGVAFAALLSEGFKARPNQRKINKLMAEAKPYIDELAREGAAMMPPKRVRIAKSRLKATEHKWLGTLGVKW